MLTFILMLAGVLIAVGGGRAGGAGWLVFLLGMVIVFACFDTMFGVTSINWPLIR